MNISKFSLRIKLVLMLLPALFGLLLYSSGVLLERYGAMKNMAELERLVELTDKLGDIVHNVQSERGISAGFLASKGEKYANELKAQRLVTDKEIAKFKQFLEKDTGMLAGNAGIKASVEAANANLAKLAQTRQAISALGINPRESFAFYTNAIISLIGVVGRVVAASNHPEMAMKAAAYLSFVQAKEQAGRERGTLNGVFTTDNFDRETYPRLLAIMAAQDVYFKSFLA